LLIYSAVINPYKATVLNLADEYVFQCQSKYPEAKNAMYALLGVYHLGEVLFCIYLAYKVRDIQGMFNESQSIGFMVYFIATIAVLIGVILSIPQLTIRVTFSVRTFGIITGCLVAQAILFFKMFSGIKAVVSEERSKRSSEKTNSQNKSKENNTTSGGMKFIEKNGVKVAISETSKSGVETKEDEEENALAKKIKEDTWKWKVFVREQKFLDYWRQCTLTYHRSLAVLSLVQKHHGKKKEAMLTVCFPLDTIDVRYKGYSVTGKRDSTSSAFRFEKIFDVMEDEFSELVLTIRLKSGARYSVQMATVKHVEQIVQLVSGALLNDVNTVFTEEGGTNDNNRSQSKHDKSTDKSKDTASEDQSESQSQHQSSHHHQSQTHSKSGVHSKSQADSERESMVESHNEEIRSKPAV
jgi:hypothetical protein